MTTLVMEPEQLADQLVHDIIKYAGALDESTLAGAQHRIAVCREKDVFCGRYPRLHGLLTRDQRLRAMGISVYAVTSDDRGLCVHACVDRQRYVDHYASALYAALRDYDHEPGRGQFDISLESELAPSTVFAIERRLDEVLRADNKVDVAIVPNTMTQHPDAHGDWHLSVIACT